MLPTNQKAIKGNLLLKSGSGNLFPNLKIHSGSPFDTEGGYYKPQHLYIISDDKIEDGDYYIHNNKVIQKQEDYQNSNGRKIISTTDTSLYGNYNEKIGSKIYSENYVFPQPSQQFIEQYIKTYNKGEVITEVLVEYENNLYGHIGSGKYHEDEPVMMKKYLNKEDIYLKVNQDNTINIRPIKDSWSREEVEKLCKSAWQVGFNVGLNEELFPSYLNWDEWIKENL